MIADACRLDYGKPGKPPIDWDDPQAKQSLGRSTMARQPGPDTGCGLPGDGQLVNIEPESITGHTVHLCPLIDALQAAGPAFP